jgi:hypothetical protein
MTARVSRWPPLAALALGVGLLAGPGPAGAAATGAEGTIFGAGFETGDCIAWDQLVGGCETDAQCPTQLRFFAVCQTTACFECTEDADCLNNPTALGPTCDVANRCGCASSTECAANPAGPVCDAGAGVCTCETDLDCAAPAECRPTPYLQGLTTCW